MRETGLSCLINIILYIYIYISNMYIYIYIYIYIILHIFIIYYMYYIITVEKTTYLNEKYFRLTSLSVHFMYIFSLYIYICIYGKHINFRPIHFSFYGNLKVIKDTLMQVWKSLYMFMFIWKQYPENFPFLILRILYITVKFVNFLKSRLIFNLFYCFWMFVNKLFTYLTCAYLEK